MSFAYVHGLKNTPLVAGLKMSTVPVGIGLLAPVGVWLSARLGAPRLGVLAMAICIAALGAMAFIAFGPDRMVVRLVALAMFGIGLGLFMAPNSDATIKSAPEGHVATAGALVNLSRVIGSCVGIAAASSVMSWQLRRYGAESDILVPGSTVNVPLLEAIETGLALLACLGAVAAVVSLLRRGLRPGPAAGA
jgi:MFS family permease